MKMLIDFGGVRPAGSVASIQTPAAPDLGATTYNTGEDLTFDEDGFPTVAIIRIGYDWSMPAGATPYARGGVFQSGTSWPTFWAGNKLAKIDAQWADLEAVENTYTMSWITDAFTAAIAAGNDGCMLNVRGNVTAIEDEFGDPYLPEQITAPSWMFSEATWQEGLHSSGARITNLLISNATVKQNILDLINAFDTANIAADSRLFGSIIHMVSNSQGEEFTGGQADWESPADVFPTIDAASDIIDAWGTAYGDDADKCAWLKENPIELHDRAVVTNGMGLRGGAIEKWQRNSYTPHVGSITSVETGQVYNATNNHLEWNENCLPMAGNWHWQDQNESSGSYGGGGINREFHYRAANLRMLQMRRNIVWLVTDMALDPRMDSWLSLGLGKTVSTTDSAFVWLNQSNAYISGGPKKINNMERWLCQFESQGATTPTSRRDWDKNVNDDNRLDAEFWYTDVARLADGGSIGITVNPSFISSTPTSVAVRIVYEDVGTGTWTLNVDTGGGIGSGQGVVNLDNTGAIRSVTFFFTDFEANGGATNKSFSLDDASDAVPFILVEVIKI